MKVLARRTELLATSSSRRADVRCLSRARVHEGLSCFWFPLATKRRAQHVYLQRLKEKLGNRSNASSEIEFHDAYGVMIGEEGRGVRTIIGMVQHNRYYCASASAGMMRQGLRQALHHVTHRTAFQRRLVDQPLMRNVLADLALEVEAAVAYSMRLGRAIDERAGPNAVASPELGQQSVNSGFETCSGSRWRIFGMPGWGWVYRRAWHRPSVS